jgi:hypothetical protein
MSVNPLHIELAAELSSGKYSGEALETLQKEYNKMIEESKQTQLIFAKDSEANDIYDKRAQLLFESRQSTTALTLKYGDWVDKKNLKNNRKVWVHRDHPYFYLFVPMGKDDGSRLYREGLLMKGYRPCDVRKVQDDYVVGEDAVLLEMRWDDAKLIGHLSRKKIAPPPKTPTRLEGKWGTVMPLVADPDTGYVFASGGMQLWYVEQELRGEYTKEYNRLAKEVDVFPDTPEQGIIKESRVLPREDLKTEEDVMAYIAAAKHRRTD